METRPTSDDQLEARVVVAAKAVRRAFDAGLAELELNMSEGGALANLAVHGSLTQSELAARLHIGRASAAVLVDSLESRGLIERRANPADRRVWQVSLTSTGAAVARRFDTRHAEIRAALRGAMTRTEREQIGRLLAVLADNATAYASDVATTVV
ncbi:MAG: MarR family transcriptional regulator [Actinobacteria bacterium]|nr:MarR family transcriptional regulator [Actinomycetota bacterium]